MAARYETELAALAGDFWKIEILDDEHSGSSSDFVLVDFKLDRKSLVNRWDSVWGSEVQLDVLSNADFDLTDLIEDIRTAPEGRFKVVLYRKGHGAGSYVFEWLGLVLNDLSGGSDEGPNEPYLIVATDGLGALKGIDYAVDSITPYPDATIIEVLLNCLNQLPTSDYFTTGDAFLIEAVNYFENQMPNMVGSSLDFTKVPGTAFYDFDKEGAYIFRSCYEVIEIVANLFFARIGFWGGAWRFYNVRSWETSSSLVTKRWRTDGVQKTNETDAIRISIDEDWTGARLATQTFGAFSPLRKVSRVFKHDTARSLVNPNLIFDSNAALQNVIVQLKESGKQYLAFSGSLFLSASEDPVTVTTLLLFVKVRITVTVGGYYLKRNVTDQTQNNDFTSLAWSNLPNYVEFIGSFTSTVAGNTSLAISFNTPPLPDFNVGTLQMQVEKVSITDISGTSKASLYNYYAKINGLFIEYVDDNAENERTYYALNNTSAFLSDVEELPDLIIGDKVGFMTRDRLLVWNGSDFVDSEGDWGLNTLSGNTNLIQLVLENIIAGQRTAIKKRLGSFVGSFETHKVLGVSGEYYLPLSVSYVARDSVYSGEWYKVGTYNDSGIVSGVFVAPVLNSEPPSLLPPSAGGSPSLPANVTGENGKISIQSVSGVAPFTVVKNIDDVDIDIFEVDADNQAINLKQSKLTVYNGAEANAFEVLEESGSTVIMNVTEDANGAAQLNIDGYITFKDKLPADVPIKTLFLNFESGKLAFKNAAGTVIDLY